MTIQGDRKPKILYVLGQAYSGTTLFSLALGNEDSFLNLGEVSRLEYDYHDQKVCSCGKSLEVCPNWSPIKRSLSEESTDKTANFQLTNESTLDFLDQTGKGRGWWINIQLALGLPISWIYDSDELNRYLSKNENFFKTVGEVFPGQEFLVDCSKSSERLANLVRSDKLEIWCIYLKRSTWAVAASKFKRASSSSNWLVDFLISLKYMLWLRVRQSRIESQFRLLPEERKMKVLWEDFVAQPAGHINKAKTFLGIGSDSDQQLREQNILTNLQHVYVGNNWLFNSANKRVNFKLRDDITLMSKAQRFAVRLVFGRQPVKPEKPV